MNSHGIERFQGTAQGHGGPGQWARDASVASGAHSLLSSPHTAQTSQIYQGPFRPTSGLPGAWPGSDTNHQWPGGGVKVSEPGCKESPGERGGPMTTRKAPVSWETEEPRDACPRPPVPHLCLFPLLPICTTGTTILSYSLFYLYFCPDTCPGMGLLDYMEALFLVFWGTSILFSIVAAPAYIQVVSVFRYNLLLFSLEQFLKSVNF